MWSKKGAEFFMLGVVVAAVHALRVETPKKKMEVAKGGNATLPCTFQTSFSLQKGDIVYWTKMSTEVEIINMYLDDGGTMEGMGYQGRVSYSGSPQNGDLSITLNKLTMDDNGTYECSVRLRADPPLTHAAMDLVVLVPPSKPVCQIIGRSEYGYNINLTCNSVEGSPKPQYSWQSYDAQNQPRALEGIASGGLLALKNISANTAGYYICIARNSVGEAQCNMTVAVAAPSMNIALYAGIIGGVVAALIIIGVLAYCCFCRKKNEKDYEMTETENKYEPPKKVPVEIRGPAEEEIQDEEEDYDEKEDEESGKHKPMMPPNHH
ncbi:hypothetical protein lerEdw1_011333 [Lerista edwardsae]|nr:hypothetical protein lerEdw1_011333 [Lerista edwardsae]